VILQFTLYQSKYSTPALTSEGHSQTLTDFTGSCGVSLRQEFSLSLKEEEEETRVTGIWELPSRIVCSHRRAGDLWSFVSVCLSYLLTVSLTFSTSHHSFPFSGPIIPLSHFTFRTRRPGSQGVEPPE
jgi:hypothetical protein